MRAGYRLTAVRDHLLSALASGRTVNAQQLADSLAVSLNAVQQAASRLRKAGMHLASGVGHAGLWYQRCSALDPRLNEHRHGSLPRR
jgi:biotin operon repressor